MFSFYEVGGKVRDELLGIQSKDFDYVVVPDMDRLTKGSTVEDVFNLVVEDLKLKGFEIFLITPKMFTIRAKFPTGEHKGRVADFVVARKELGYKHGTREPIVVPGTLYDDLQRRDFTVNALAKDGEGKIIDYFGGIKDLNAKVLKTPIRGSITFTDDPLRLLRAIRFSVTKNFYISNEVDSYISYFDYNKSFGVVSEERIREELHKCFKHNTLATLKILEKYFNLKNYIFSKTHLWLKPTNEK